MVWNLRIALISWELRNMAVVVGSWFKCVLACGGRTFHIFHLADWLLWAALAKHAKQSYSST